MGRGNGTESPSFPLIPKLAGAVLILLLILLPAALMTYKVISSTSVECEVCMEFGGKTECRRAMGPSREACRKTATDNACAFLASGMMESANCSRAAPLRVEFSAPDS